MTTRHAFLAAAALALATAVPAAHADELRPTLARDINAEGLDLGAVSGVVYYTVERGGFHVVATLSEPAGDATPVRVEAVLAPGQSVLLSTPRGVGEASEAVEISREADTVLVHKVTAAAATN